MDHATVRKQCQAFAKVAEHPLADFANTVSELQALRHEADYNPMFRLSKQECLRWIERARAALEDWNNNRNLREKRDLLARILFKQR